jgi:Mg-chelatase subunit ChlD
MTEITIILDRSGSMQTIAGDAVGGFNAFLEAQRREEGEARLSLVLFDDEYEVPVKSQPLAGVPALTAATYQPRGSTALLDAIGRTIKKMTTSFAAREAEARPGKVIVAILTDGEENASSKYTQAHVSDLIAEKRAQGWEFVFLAANQDAFATAEVLNIPREDAASFQSDAAGTQRVFEEMTTRVSLKRRC